MHEEVDRTEVHDRRQDTDLDHIEVRHPSVLGDQEGAGTHQRRHDLPTGGGRRLDAPGLMGLVAKALHQRNGKGASGHHVGDGAAGDRSHAGRGDHRRLGRSTTLTAGGGVGQIDEELAGASDLEKGAEQHEDEDIGGRHAHGQAEDALLPQVELAHQAIQAVATVLEDAGQPLAQPRQVATRTGEGVEQRYHPDHRHAQPYRTARRFKHGDDRDAADHDIGLTPEAGTIDDLVEVEHQVAAGDQRPGEEGGIEQPTDEPTGSSRSEYRKHQEGQHHDQHQVDAALVEEPQRLDAGGVELEQRQAHRHQRDQPQHRPGVTRLAAGHDRRVVRIIHCDFLRVLDRQRG